MKREQNHQVLFAGWIILVFAWAGIFFGINTSIAFTLGRTYESSNWQEIENDAPPFLVNWVKKGDFILKTGAVNFNYELEKDFLQASRENMGKFDFDEQGFIVEKETRKRPNFIYGHPFPDISPGDEKAGKKIMADELYSFMRFGAFSQAFRLLFVGKKGMERSIDVVTKNLFYQGRPGGPIQNTDNFQHQWVALVVSPMDMKGTVQLFWEYNDERLGTSFTYASMIRRITRATPNTRSNPFLDGDTVPDDDPLWGGKNNTFNWKLIGEKEILCGFSGPDKLLAKDLPDGSFDRVCPQLTMAYEIPDWKGASWAPVNTIWSPRSVWIVEGVPKDTEYNYGRQLFYVDKETFIIWFKEVYDKSGQYWKGLFTVQSYQLAPSGRTNLFRFDYLAAIDDRTQHATYDLQLESASGINNVLHCPKSLIGPDDFTVVAAQKMTK